jgi:hypothetical protein
MGERLPLIPVVRWQNLRKRDGPKYPRLIAHVLNEYGIKSAALSKGALSLNHSDKH